MQSRGFARLRLSVVGVIAYKQTIGDERLKRVAHTAVLRRLALPRRRWSRGSGLCSPIAARISSVNRARTASAAGLLLVGRLGLVDQDTPTINLEPQPQALSRPARRASCGCAGIGALGSASSSWRPRCQSTSAAVADRACAPEVPAALVRVVDEEDRGPDSWAKRRSGSRAERSDRCRSRPSRGLSSGASRGRRGRGSFRSPAPRPRPCRGVGRGCSHLPPARRRGAVRACGPGVESRARRSRRRGRPPSRAHTGCRRLRRPARDRVGDRGCEQRLAIAPGSEQAVSAARGDAGAAGEASLGGGGAATIAGTSRNRSGERDAVTSEPCAPRSVARISALSQPFRHASRTGLPRWASVMESGRLSVPAVAATHSGQRAVQSLSLRYVRLQAKVADLGENDLNLVERQPAHLSPSVLRAKSAISRARASPLSTAPQRPRQEDRPATARRPAARRGAVGGRSRGSQLLKQLGEHGQDVIHAEGARHAAGGAEPWGVTLRLESADRVAAYAGPVGEFLLCEVGGEPKPTEEGRPVLP